LERWLGDWTRRIQTPQNSKELEAQRTSLDKGRRFGDAAWQAATMRRRGWNSGHFHGRPVAQGRPP
jgi:hypothetical protein